VTWSSPRGGLCESASVESARLLRKHEKAIFSAAPLISLRVWFVTIKSGDTIAASAKELAKSSRLGHVRHLEVAGMTHADNLGLDRLAGSAALANLRELDISESGHEDDLIRALARCPAWPSLESLRLYRGMFTDLRPLVRSPLFGSLRGLALGRSSVGNAGLLELVREGRFARLNELKLGENEVSGETVRALAESPFERLERLDLSFNDLGTTAVAALAGSAQMKSLRSLDLGINSDLGDAAATELAQSPHLGSLVDLDLGSWSLKAKGVRALAGSPWLKNVRRLKLWGFSAGRRGLEALAGADLPALRWLDLYDSGLKDADLRVILRAGWAARLITLNLSSNALTAAGARQLVKSAALEKIESLDVSRNQIDDEGKELLRQRFGDRVVVKTPWG
jgi:hypothetical protein